jgi:Transposase DDE domain
MPVRSHHTASSQQPQSHLSKLDNWTSEVLPRLPSDFEQQARQLQAFQRSRAFDCPASLLRGLLLYALSPFGFRWLGAWGVLSGVADLSAPAWHKALIRSSAWLLWLIAELLVTNDRPIWISQRVRRRVWIVDASMLGQVGQTGDAWRLHLGFDLVAGQVGQVHLSDRYTGERLDHFELMPGDLVLLDAGYGYRSTLAFAQSKAADLLMPFTPRTCPLETSCGQELDLLAWLRQEGASLRERSAWWRYQGKRGQVRIIAKRLSEQQRRARERRLYQKAQKHARAVSEQALFLCGFMLLISSLPADSWTAEELLWLYRARWQVELVFKRIKQLLRLGQIRASSRAGAEATIRALLVAWLLQEQNNRQMQALLVDLLPVPSEQEQQAHNPAVVSNWTLTVLSLETLRQQVQGHWNQARVQECLPRLRRFLTSRSSRPHQQSQIWAFLSGQSQPRQSVQRRAA